MKNAMKSVVLLTVAIAMGAIYVGCEPAAEFNTEKKDISGGGSTSGSGKNDNTTGGGTTTDAGDGSDIDISGYKTYSGDFTNCSYALLGSTSTVDAHMLLLADDNYNWETRKGEGNWALVEIFTKKGEGIVSGKYCLNDSMTAGTSYICTEGENNTVSGPMFGMGGYAYVCPNAGYVEIKKSGDNYSIHIRYIDESNERFYEGSFSGTISDYEGGGEGGDAEYTQCEADFFGEYNGTGDWGIYLGDDATDMSDLSGGSWVMIELFTSTTTYSAQLPTGTFKVADTEAAGTVGSIYEGEDGYYYGSMSGTDNTIEVGATSGSITISKSGDDYTIKVDFIDDDYEVELHTSYTGKVDFYDLSEEDAKKFMWKKDASMRKSSFLSLPRFEVR